VVAAELDQRLQHSRRPSGVCGQAVGQRDQRAPSIVGDRGIHLMSLDRLPEGPRRRANPSFKDGRGPRSRTSFDDAAARALCGSPGVEGVNAHSIVTWRGLEFCARSSSAATNSAKKGTEA
jgi:hypothetical protein